MRAALYSRAIITYELKEIKWFSIDVRGCVKAHKPTSSPRSLKGGKGERLTSNWINKIYVLTNDVI